MDLNTTLKRLRSTFFLFVALLGTLALLSWHRGGTTIVAQGHAWWMQSALVTINVAVVPIAWKMMSLGRIRSLVSRKSEEGLRAYYRYSVLRLAVIAVPAVADFTASGLMIDDTYAGMAMMLGVAMLMFYPTRLLYDRDTRQ